MLVLFGAGLAFSIACVYSGSEGAARICVALFGFGFVWAFNRCSRRELLVVTRQELDFVHQYLFHQSRHRYFLRSIRAFRPLEADVAAQASEPGFTDRLGTAPAAAFRYRGRTVLFGTGLASWEVWELEEAIAGFTGYDLRYDNKGGYGAPAASGEKIPLAGQWEGIYTMGATYGPRLAGRQERFRLYIDEVSDRSFRGKCLDLEGTYAHLEPASVNGYTDGGYIEFHKQYAYSTAVRPDGEVYVDFQRRQPPVLYRGQFDAQSGSFSGEWEIATVVEIGHNYQKLSVLKGTWEAWKDD